MLTNTHSGNDVYCFMAFTQFSDYICNEALINLEYSYLVRS